MERLGTTATDDHGGVGDTRCHMMDLSERRGSEGVSQTKEQRSPTITACKA